MPSNYLFINGFPTGEMSMTESVNGIPLINQMDDYFVFLVSWSCNTNSVNCLY